jgi:LacI family transcriptional regulator
MSRPSTLKQLAQALDISVATASRALAGYADISAKTRLRVAEKAREIGYVANSAGRMLVSGRSGFVGLIMPIRGPNFVDSFLGEFVTGLGEGLVARGADLFIATAPKGQSEIGILKHVVDSGRADGIVLTRVAVHDERVSFLIDRGFPFVAHGRVLDAAAPYAWLDTSGEDAFAEAFERLYSLGHRRFGLVTIDEAMTFRHYREQGLRRAVAARADPEVALQTVSAPRFDVARHRAGISAMLASPQRPTAVIGLFDELALIAMKEAEALGLSVPADLSVIGFDNAPAAAFSTPGLTTFDQATRESAREIAGMLLDVIEKTRPAPRSELKRPQYMARGSHGPAPVL